MRLKRLCIVSGASLLLLFVLGCLCFSPKKASALTIASPTNLSVNEAAPTQVSLSWTASTTSGVTYNILRNGQVIGSTDSYTANYLDTGLTPGQTYTYTITAQEGGQSSSPSAALQVTTGTTTTTISSCGTTIASGSNYILTADVTGGPSANNDCINLSNANHFSLDCQGHTITLTGGGLYVLNGTSPSNLLVTNCTFISSSTPSYKVVNVSSISNATFENNTFGTTYNTYQNASYFTVNGTATNLILNGNTFTMDQFDATANNSYIGNNTFMDNATATTNIAEAMNLSLGSSNIIYKNTIDGGSSDGSRDIGFDDGIILGQGDKTSTETDDTVAYNTISNVWDAGIETLGLISNTVMTHNAITNAFVGGITSYHYTSWMGNTLSYNTFSFTAQHPSTFDNQWPALFLIYNADADVAGVSTYFENNNFIGNIENPGTYSTDNYGANIDFREAGSFTQPVPNSVLTNNSFTGNNFSTGNNSYSPLIMPQSLVVDGGSNICSTILDPAHDYGQTSPPFVCNASSSTTPPSSGGTSGTQVTTTTISDNRNIALTVTNGSIVILDGTRGATEVQSGGTLKGNGTTGSLLVDQGGTIAPGHSPGCITDTGNLTLNGNYNAELNGTTACSGYDQLVVTGSGSTVTLTGSTLNLIVDSGFKPATGSTYEIINNGGSSAVTGTFNNLAEGATFTVSGNVFKITYKGGDGNDVVLSIVSVPAAPDTGFALAAAHPGTTLGVTIVSAGAVFGLARRSRKTSAKAHRQKIN